MGGGVYVKKRRILTLCDITVEGESIPKNSVYEYENVTPVGYFVRMKSGKVTLFHKTAVTELDPEENIPDPEEIKDDREGKPQDAIAATDGRSVINFNGPVTVNLKMSDSQLNRAIKFHVDKAIKNFNESFKELNYGYNGDTNGTAGAEERSSKPRRKKSSDVGVVQAKKSRSKRIKAEGSV